jgi:hypothetical protein
MTGNDLFVSSGQLSHQWSMEDSATASMADPSAATSQLKIIAVLAPNRLTNEEIILQIVVQNAHRG